MPHRTKTTLETEGDSEGERPKEIICPKCDEPNSRYRNACEQCGAHLHIRCHSCGHRNERSASHCVECGHRLHRSLWRKIEKKVFFKRKQLKIWQIVLLAIMVWAAYKILIAVSNFGFKPLL